MAIYSRAAYFMDWRVFTDSFLLDNYISYRDLFQLKNHIISHVVIIPNNGLKSPPHEGGSLLLTPAIWFAGQVDRTVRYGYENNL